MMAAPAFIVFAFWLILYAGLGFCTHDCTPARCFPYAVGPEVQFPFRLKRRQPKYCGYNPGFDLYCNEHNDTVLELPSSHKFTVEFIDYDYQSVHLRSITGGRCYSQNNQIYNLSASPFHLFNGDYLVQDFTIFNCSVKNNDLGPYSMCLNRSSYGIYSIPSVELQRFHSYRFAYCTKLYKVSPAPDVDSFGRFVIFNWSCGRCESQLRNGCSLRGYATGNQLWCNGKQGNAQKRLVISGEIFGSFLFVVTLAFLYRLYVSIRENKEHQKKIESFLEDYKALKPTRFSYANIRKITNEFGEKLGEGGYGIVYKGKLSSEIFVAVKVLNNSHGNGEEFVNEVGTIGRIHHVNVVRLVGYCADGFRRALVYEFLPNESLEKFIFLEGPKRSPLSREKILDIALGVAKGIEYLHQGCDQQILHFDIKPNNVLLDHNFNPKICDFGLAKLCSKEQSGVSMTVARGTMGYIAPEVLSRTFGRVSYKSDVYSFGMLLLEMVGGRKNVDRTANTSQVYFPKWIYDRLNREEISVQIDEDEDEESKITRKLTIVGLWCIQWNPTDRPSMKSVVQMLEGDGSHLSMPQNPFPATNTPNSVARMPRRHHQTELEIISELE